jgi:hypothetical protein
MGFNLAFKGLIHSTPKKSSKITHILKLFHMEKRTNEERQGNVTLNVAAQDVEFDFRFGSQHVTSQTGVLCTISLKHFEYNCFKLIITMSYVHDRQARAHKDMSQM